MNSYIFYICTVSKDTVVRLSTLNVLDVVKMRFSELQSRTYQLFMTARWLCFGNDGESSGGLLPLHDDVFLSKAQNPMFILLKKSSNFNPINI